METATLTSPSQQLPRPHIQQPPAMLSFDNPHSSNPFTSPYDHPYSSIGEFDESDYEPLLPTRNPFRDPSLSSSNINLSSSERTIQSPPNTDTNTNTTTTTNFRTAKHTNLYTNPPAPDIRYTDESIIPAIITNVIPSPSTIAKSPSLSSRPSFLRKLSLKGSESKKKDGNGQDGKKDEEKGILKVVYMPRREYLKYFARGVKGEYIGSEPYRRWREEELEERFGKFRPVTIGRGRGRGRGRW